MRPELKDIFATRLGQVLKERRLSHNQLAKVSGVGQRSVSRIVKGEQDPTLGMVDAIAAALGMPPISLLSANGTGEPHGTVRKLTSPYPPVFAAQQHMEKKSRSAKSRKE